MKVYINREVVHGPYGGGNLFVKAYHEFAAKTPEVELVCDNRMLINPDVILVAGLENLSPTQISIDQAVMYQMTINPTCKIVLRVNENDARKGTNHMDDLLLKVAPHVDGTVFVSHWLKDYFVEKGWACKNNTIIYNGVDREVFKPQPKLNNGKINIVAHHWSDNRMKGADIYEALDQYVGEHSDRFTFTYIGRHKCDFKHTKVIAPLHGKALGEELGKYDVYVSASRWDPGPNHVLEALSCGLPTYVHADGGGCVEFAGPNATYRNWSTLKMILENCDPTALNNPAWGVPLNQAIDLPTWQQCVEEYNQFLEATWQTRPSDSQSS